MMITETFRRVAIKAIMLFVTVCLIGVLHAGCSKAAIIETPPTATPALEAIITPAPAQTEPPTPEPTLAPTPTLSPDEVDFGISEARYLESYKTEDIYFVDMVINSRNVYVLCLEKSDPEQKEKIILSSFFDDDQEDFVTTNMSEFVSFFNDPSKPLNFEMNMDCLSDDEVEMIGVTILTGLEYYLVWNDKPGKAEAVSKTVLDPNSIITVRQVEEWYRNSFFRENWFVPSEFE